MLTEDEAKDYNAQCLDGSPPAIYYAPARGAANQDKWVLYFKGGGWCFNERDCAGRSRTVLGSSTLLPENLKDTWDKTSGENVMSVNQARAWGIHAQFLTCRSCV